MLLFPYVLFALRRNALNFLFFFLILSGCPKTIQPPGPTLSRISTESVYLLNKFAQPKMQVIALAVTGDFSQTFESISSNLLANVKSQKGDGAMDALKSLLRPFEEIKNDGPAAAALIRLKSQVGFALMIERSSAGHAPFNPAQLKEQGLKFWQTDRRVFIGSSAGALAWIKKNGLPMVQALEGQKNIFRLEVDGRQFIPASPNAPALNPIIILAHLHDTMTIRFGPAVAQALKPMLGHDSHFDLSLLPADTEVIAGIHLPHLVPWLREQLGPPVLRDVLSEASGELLLAYRSSPKKAINLSAYIRFNSAFAEAVPQKLFDLIKAFAPQVKSLLGSAITLRKDGASYMAEIPVPGPLRSQLEAEGVKLSDVLRIYWRSFHQHLVVSTSPISSEKKALPRTGEQARASSGHAAQAGALQRPVSEADATTRAGKQAGILSGTGEQTGNSSRSGKNQAASQRPLAIPQALLASPVWGWSRSPAQGDYLRWTRKAVTLYSSGFVEKRNIGQSLKNIPGFVFALLLKKYVLEAFKIPSAAMFPTLLVGDHVFVDKRGHGRLPRRGEVVVFTYPKDPSKDFIKRVIGLPGDIIAYGQAGNLLLNGEKIPHTPCSQKIEQMIFDAEQTEKAPRKKLVSCAFETLGTHRYRIALAENAIEQVLQEIKVPRGQVFVMGDNRPNSFDSRFFGTVPITDIKGQAKSIYWSFEPGKSVRWERLMTLVK